MGKSNPFDHAPNLPGVGPNTVDPATNATGPAPMHPGNDDQNEGVSPSEPTQGTEGWGKAENEKDKAA